MKRIFIVIILAGLTISSCKKKLSKNYPLEGTWVAVDMKDTNHDFQYYKDSLGGDLVMEIKTVKEQGALGKRKKCVMKMYVKQTGKVIIADEKNDTELGFSKCEKGKTNTELLTLDIKIEKDTILLPIIKLSPNKGYCPYYSHMTLVYKMKEDKLILKEATYSESPPTFILDCFYEQPDSVFIEFKKQ